MAKRKKINPATELQSTVTKKTEAEIKAESDKRRAARQKQRIRIHAGSIENLEETEAQAKRDAVEVKETGYSVNCMVYYRESRWNWLRRIVNALTSWAYFEGQKMFEIQYINRIEFKKKFIEKRVVTRCITLFRGKNNGQSQGMVLQPVPMEYLNRMAVEHIEKKPLAFLRRYPYYADLNSCSAVEVLKCAGVNPLATKSVRFRLVEMNGKDRPKDKELAYYYKMVPKGNFVPMEIRK